MSVLHTVIRDAILIHSPILYTEDYTPFEITAAVRVILTSLHVVLINMEIIYKLSLKSKLKNKSKKIFKVLLTSDGWKDFATRH